MITSTPEQFAEVKSYFDSLYAGKPIQLTFRQDMDNLHQNQWDEDSWHTEDRYEYEYQEWYFEMHDDRYYDDGDDEDDWDYPENPEYEAEMDFRTEQYHMEMHDIGVQTDILYRIRMFELEGQKHSDFEKFEDSISLH